ncbi:MAG TPA: hypothetical protein DIU15_16305, partial [Deltaproteobacteria bacterium]|nr:hypothetical protein [Deltaproteobacteria bacterium]
MTTYARSFRSLFFLALLSACLLSLSGCDLIEQLGSEGFLLEQLDPDQPSDDDDDEHSGPCPDGDDDDD